MAEKAEQPTEGQSPARPEAKKPAKKAKQPKQKTQDDDVYLPVLAEFTFTSSAIFLILAFLAMAAVSWLAGTRLLDFVLRTSAAMAVLGGLLISVTRQVTRDVLNASMSEIKEELQETVIEELSEGEKPKNLEYPQTFDGAETSMDPETPVVEAL